MYKFVENKLPILDIWRQSFDLYKKTLSKVWYISLLIALIASLDFSFAKGGATQHSASHLSLTFIILAVIAFLVNVILSAVIMHRIYLLAADANADVFDSVGVVLKKLTTILPAMLLYGAAVYIGLLLLVVPGVFAFVAFLFALPLILFANLKWFDSLKGSFELVWGNWWRTFLIAVVPIAIIGLTHALFRGITTHMAILGYIPVILVSTVILTVLKPYIDALILVQFHDLKLRQKPEPAAAQTP